MSLTNLFDVSERAVVVTGAGSGIGRAIALGWAGLGARVLATDVSAASLLETKQLALDAGTSLDVEHLDVTDHTASRRLFDSLASVDTVFANAGVAGAMTPATELTLEEWQKTLRVNLEGAFITATSAAAKLTASGRGRLVFTASVWGPRGTKSAPVAAYAASKAGVIGLTKQLAVELAGSGVRVDALAPAGIVTNIASGMMLSDEGTAAIRERTLSSTVVEPDSVLGAAVFLGTNASCWTTGQLLAVDGGYLTT